MTDRHMRSRPLLGDDGLRRLAEAHVVLLGLGGVGSYTAEALTRSGVGHLTLVDGDRYEPSNLNRQLGALETTLGRYKTDVTAERLRAIAPTMTLTLIARRLTSDDVSALLTPDVSMVLDAIDDVSVKVALATQCDRRQVPLISCLGTGNKWDLTQLVVCDLFATQNDPLARRMRQRMRAAGVNRLDVVFSPEVPCPSPTLNGRPTPASLPFVPGAAGLLLAQTCVKRLIAHAT